MDFDPWDFTDTDSYTLYGLANRVRFFILNCDVLETCKDLARDYGVGVRFIIDNNTGKVL